MRADATPHQIDNKFKHTGWALDPHRCPDCRARKNKPMASTPTPAATKAMGKIFMLLIAHFDVEKGAYAKGWSDQKIATETGMSLDTVTDLRRETFGEIKEPAEVATLREDIRSLEALLTEQIAAMRSRLADISKRWAA